MKEHIEFQEIGKRTPYKAPDSFFEQISERTLQKAKAEEHSRKKILFVWRTLAVAASLAALVTLGYYTSALTQEKHPDSPKTIVQKKDLSIQPQVAEHKISVPKTISEPAMEKETAGEYFGDVLADLSDEELLELAAMYQSDPFMGESDY